MDFQPAPSLRAIDYIRRKAVVPPAVWRGLLPELRAHAFTVAGVASADTLQAMRDAIADIPRGGDYDRARAEVERLLNAALPREPQLLDDEEEAAKHRAAMRRRAEFIVRNQVNAGYAAASYAELSQFRDVLTYWKYITVSDDRVRDSHRALNNIILPASHPFWELHFPPWEFGCRCQIVGITASEADAVREKEKGLPQERRTLIEGEALRLLEQERALWRDAGGRPEKINVSAPAERGDENPWRFDPRDLAASYEGLRQSYDAQVWAVFEKWARATEYQPGRSVWGWLQPAVARGEKNLIASGVPQAAAARSARDFEAASRAAVKSAGGATHVSYKGAHVKAAQAMHAALEEHLREFPELARHLEYYGTSTGQGDWARQAFEQQARRAAEAWFRDHVFRDEEHRRATVDAAVRRALSRQVLRSPKALAFYWHRRIVANPDYSRDGPERDAASERAHAAGWWPRTIPPEAQYKAIADHEIAHALDAMSGARDDAGIRALWAAELASAGREAAAQKLSIYGGSKLSEMIAEAWSEARNAPRPRPLARAVAAALRAKLQPATAP